MNCDKCGAFIDDESLFECPECGAALNQEQELINEIENEIESEDNDVSSFEDDTEDESQNSADGEPAYDEPTDEGGYDDDDNTNEEDDRQSQLDAIQARRDAKLRKSQHKRVVGAIFLAIVIVAVAGCGLYILAQNSDLFKDGKNVVSEATEEPQKTGDVVLSAGADLSGRTIKALDVVVSKEDKYYIKFSLDDKKYYARINYGTTREQIENNLYIVDAHADEEYKCDGKIAYVLDTIVRGKKADEYILPQSEKQLLTKADIQGLEAGELNIARYEIYARHGMKFTEERLKEYFTAKTWYKPVDDFNDSVLSAIELKNAEFILAREKVLEGK